MRRRPDAANRAISGPTFSRRRRTSAASSASDPADCGGLDVLNGGPAVMKDKYPIRRLIALNLTYWYIPALLTPAIMAFAVRHPISRTNWPRQLPLHIACALSYSIAHTAAMIGVRFLLNGHSAFGRPEVGWLVWV